jgi:predicted GTPase
MLAGSRIADVSGSASGCTPSNKRYSISHGDDEIYTFWDTAGLNENEAGTVSHQTALQNLQDIIKDDGVDLLVYCMRDRLVDIIRDNYDLFWRDICKERVPIVLVVTGLEGKEDKGAWWRENKKTIKKMGMSFNGYACITSWKGRGDMYEKEYKESAEEVWNLVRGHCKVR